MDRKEACTRPRIEGDDDSAQRKRFARSEQHALNGRCLRGAFQFGCGLAEMTPFGAIELQRRSTTVGMPLKGGDVITHPLAHPVARGFFV